MNTGPQSSSLEASCNTGEVIDCSDRTKGSVGIALRDLAIGFQTEMSQQINKFTEEMQAAATQESGCSACSVEQRDMQLQKAELIIQIQSMATFITNKLHEHQLLEKLDPKPSASHCQ